METACGGQVVRDLHACLYRTILHRRSAKDMSERYYQGGIPRSQISSMPGVRISDVVEEVRPEYVPVASPAHETSKIRCFPSKRKKNISCSPMKLPRKI